MISSSKTTTFFKLFPLFICTVLLVACGKSHDQYIGEWKARTEGKVMGKTVISENIMVIKKIDSSTYTLGTKNNTSTVTLSPKDSLLEINGGQGAVIVHNSKDDTLTGQGGMFAMQPGSASWTRVSK
jgi:hypothetical protein